MRDCINMKLELITFLPPLPHSVQESANTNLLTTIQRRTSFRHRPHAEPRPPSYPAIVAGHSFDLNELGGDSDEEEGLTAAAPPQYLDIVG